MEDKQLQVGDILYNRMRFTTDVTTVIVERVTKSMAFAGRYKLNRQIQGGRAKVIGAGYYETQSLWAETEELVQLKKRTLAKSLSKTVDYSTLPIEKVDLLIDILTPPTQ